MKTSSAKAKGRSLQNKVTLRFRELFNGILEDGDIKPQIMGVSGEDIVLSPSAKKLIAFDIECKNQEKLIGVGLTNAIEQAEGNSSEDRIPLLIFKKNREPERVILRLDDFMELVYPNSDVTFTLDEKQKLLIKIEELKQQILKDEHENSRHSI